jgi:putative oxidoreductase
LFIPAGLMKVTGFAATVVYISSLGLPLPELRAVYAIIIEMVVAGAFLVGFKTKEAALILAIFTFTISGPCHQASK